MILASFAEILSIGAVLPFLGVLTAPDRVFKYPAAQPFIEAMGLTTSDQLLLPLTIAFGLAAVAAGAMRLLLLWASTRLSFATGADLSISIYRRTLYQPYDVHVARNSSEVINGISSKANGGIYSTIVPALTLISTSVMLIAILIAMLPNQYQTFVGERGIRLSGGQRQRIGIARALYKQADVIIFDEATSALDNDTEQAVMQAIEGLSKDLTILIIAHRLTTLRNCTHIVELGSAGVLRSGSYQQLVIESPSTN